MFNVSNKCTDWYECTHGCFIYECSLKSIFIAKQLEKLKIKTNIQRSDSTLISSNIRKYSRVQLLIEVLLRLSRLFDPADKDALSELIKPYSKLGSEKYIYQLKSSDLTHELKKLGELYYDIYEYVKIKCPYQKVKSTPTKKRNKAIFDTKKCNVCLLKE